jgi:hypothetical protein
MDMPDNRGFFRTLRDSGCIGVSVGFESANRRILEKINKGIQIRQVESQMRKLAEEGIGVQLMGFTGFPTETFEEACESISFLERTRDLYVFAALGSFLLTSGSKIAREPAEFGICNLRFRTDDDLLALPEYDEIVPSKTALQKKEISKLKDELNKNRSRLSRPFLGGIDTPHSLMYLNHYGLRIKSELEKATLQSLEETNQIVCLNGVVIDHWPSYIEFDSKSVDNGKYHIIVEDGSIFSCGNDIAEVANLLTRNQTLESVLNQIYESSLSRELHLVCSLDRLRELGLINKGPKLPLEDKHDIKESAIVKR